MIPHLLLPSRASIDAQPGEAGFSIIRLNLLSQNYLQSSTQLTQEVPKAYAQKFPPTAVLNVYFASILIKSAWKRKYYSG